MSSVKCFFCFEIPIKGNYGCAPHEHSCTEIVFNNGCCGISYNGKKSAGYSDGTFMVSQPGDWHWIKNENAGKQLCIGINGCHAEKIPSGVYGNIPTVVKLKERIRDERISGKAYSGDYLDMLAGELVLEILRAASMEEDLEEVSFHAEEARKILDASFEEKISIKDIAKKLSINPDYLRQLFRNTFGESPQQYLTRRRMDHACHLLWGSEYPLTEIAKKCGMDSPYYFSRAFRKFTGLPPSEYRKKFKRD